MIHTIRLGTHAEKDYLLRATAWYDEVLVNANLLEGTASSTSYFVFELGRRNKGFFVDPVTYAFALNPRHMTSEDVRGERRFKRTFLSLAKRYGLIEEDADTISQLDLSELQSNADLKRSFCRSVLTYQQSRVRDALEADSDFIGETPDIRPTRLFAPYFFLSDEQSLTANEDLVRTSQGIATDEFNRGVWALICFDGLLLDERDAVRDIGLRYANLPCEGYGIWLTDFDEQRATRSQIQGLALLTRQLMERNASATVVDMYGGYFAALLHPIGIGGISHGVGYGERRDIVPVVGGGPPPAKYYLPGIHEAIYLPELVQLAQTRSPSQFLDQICHCVICRGLLRTGINGLIDQFIETVTRPYGRSSRDFPSPTVYRLTKFHFMHNRHMELDDLRSTNLQASAQALLNSYDTYGPELGHSRLTFLRRWGETLHQLEGPAP